MSSNPLNLAIRLLLELTALIAFGIWGWRYGHETWLRLILAIGLPIIAASIWGIFNVPNDPSRSGAAPIIVPGLIRLAIELTIFTLAIWSLFYFGYTRLSLLLGGVVAAHYLASYDRIIWLLKH